MITALLDGGPASGKTTLALHLAAAWAARRERVIVVDVSSTLGALRWHEMRIRTGLVPLFRVVPAAPERLDPRSLARLARRAHVIIDGPSGDSALSLRALLVGDLAIIPTRPSPANMAAALAMVSLALDARARSRAAPVRFVFNRSRPRFDRDREIAEMRAEYEPALLDSTVDHHGIFADAMAHGRLVDELVGGDPACRDIAALADELLGLPLPALVNRRTGSLLARLLPPWVRDRSDRAPSEPAVAFTTEDSVAIGAPVASDGEPS